MENLYNEILRAKSQKRKLLAILLDPDKIQEAQIPTIISKVNACPATHILVGGSFVFKDNIDQMIVDIKQNTDLPVMLFPGNPSQISAAADGILFLSLISGRNPDFLIGHHVKAAPILKNTTLEIIPTGYILIESGNTTAVQEVSQTQPISNPELILHTAQAGEMSGNKLIYLEAGSGAQSPVPLDVVKLVSEGIDIPLIVGGGIRNKKAIDAAYSAGADMVVIGTAFENDLTFFEN
jgi:phosphoglycerol geranylgeranyltransferase